MPSALDVVAPAPPGLQHDLVAALAQRLAERDDREGVAGVAEGAEEDPHGAARRRLRGGQLGHEPQLLEAVGLRLNASGVTPSVPTPASR